MVERRVQMVESEKKNQLARALLSERLEQATYLKVIETIRKDDF